MDEKIFRGFSDPLSKRNEEVIAYRQKLLNLKQDHQKLLEESGISLTSDTIKSLNSIDMVNFLSPAVQECIEEAAKIYSDSEYNKLTMVPSVFISEKLRGIASDLSGNNNFFHYIPCFEEGTIKINKKAWIYFKILNLDVDNQTLDVKLHLYKREHLDGGFVLCLQNASHIEFRDNKPHITQITDDSLSPSEVYTVKSDQEHKNIGWNETDIKMWKDVVIASRAKTEEKNREYVHKHAFIDLATSAEQAETEVLFFCCVQVVNELMEKETLSRAKKITEPRKTRINTPDVSNENPTFITPVDKRKVRTIGNSGINIVSVKAPKSPDAQYVRHYSVSSWTQAGHIRHMKSGKTIYIKPQTKHRRALLDKNVELPQKQTTLKIASDISLD